MNKFKKILMVSACLGFLFIGGCKSPGMLKVQPVDVTTIDANTALVTFIRPAFVGAAIQFRMWDGKKFIGHLSSQSYIQYKTTPGKHLFMARSENWSCVNAELEGGKSYFIIGRIRMGLLRARVVLDPVNKGGDISQEKINKWLTNLTATAADPARVEAYTKAGAEQVQAAMDNIQNGKAMSECNTLNIDDYL